MSWVRAPNLNQYLWTCLQEVDQNAQLLSAGVAPEVHLRITHVRKHARDPSGLWNPGPTSSEDLQNRGIGGHTKRTCVLQNFFFLKSCTLLRLSCIPLCLRRYSSVTIRKWMDHFFTKRRFFNAYFLLLFLASVQSVYICLRTCTVNICAATGSSTTIKTKKLREAKCAKTKRKFTNAMHDMGVLRSSRIIVWTSFPRRIKPVKNRKSRNIRGNFTCNGSRLSSQQQLELQLPVGSKRRTARRWWFP